MLRHLRLIFTLLALFSSPLLLQAAQLQLSNGDRITGAVLSREEGKVRFHSPIFGELVVSEDLATVIESPESTETAPDESVEIVAVVSLDEEAQPIESKATTLPGPKWDGRIEFGLFSQTGRRNNNNATLHIEANRVSRLNNIRLRSRYNYGKSNGIVSSDRLSADERWRREISPRIFAQSMTSYLRDRIASINLNLEQNLSLGYQVVKRLRHEINAGGGATIQYRDGAGAASDTIYLGEVFEDYAYKLNKRLSITQSINVLYSPDGRVVGASTDNDHYKFRFNSALQSAMTDRISLSLRYEYEYDNSILVKEARSDQRITSSIGYSF